MKRLSDNRDMLRKGSSNESYYYNIWPSQEIVVNKCLEAVLMAAPPEAVAEAVNSVAASAGLVSPRVCRMRSPSRVSKALTGQPDFLLFDKENDALVLGEIKIGAKPSNQRYSRDQLQKYMQLGLLARATLSLKHVVHLIVLPSHEIAKHCMDPDKWSPEVGAAGRLTTKDPERYLTFYALYQRAGEHFDRAVSLDRKAFMSPVDQDDPLTPLDTYVTSWEQLSRRLAAACTKAKADHLTDACAHLQLLGEGRFSELAN